MTVRIAVDLNVRVQGNRTFSGFEDIHGGPVELGMKVTAFEEETGVSAPAIVTWIDHEKRLVYLAVDWSSFREPAEAEDDPACE